MEYENVPAVKPVAPYIGGKRQLARRIVTRIGEIEHTTYAEPFVGMGGVFFRRRQRPKAEVINDISRDVVTLFRILNRHYPQFMDVLKYQITTRADFERLMQTPADVLTDLERAARFLYLQRTAFGGKVAGRNFGVAIGYPGRFNLLTLEPLLRDVHERLAGVVIECLPWDDFVARYDRPGTLFYLDPPYWGSESDYGAGLFTRLDFGRMASVLGGIQGRFLLSLNDTPQVRDLFRGFAVEEARVRYTVSAGPSRDHGELIISNA